MDYYSNGIGLFAVYQHYPRNNITDRLKHIKKFHQLTKKKDSFMKLKMSSLLV